MVGKNGILGTMETSLIFSFLGASVLLTLMPGPDNIFVLTESLTRGKQDGIALSFGLSTGVLVHTLAAATGLSIIIQTSAIAFQIIKYLGAAYLFYLAYKALTSKDKAVDTGSPAKSKEFWQQARKGFLMNVLNPKVSLFFIAFLPQFVSTDGIAPALQMLVLGAMFMVQAFLIFSAIAVLSGNLSKYLTSQRFWNTTRYGKAIVLTALGTLLLVARKS